MADRKISDLTALTTPASGDYLPIVDISEAAASASKNKRITIEELMRGAPDGTAAAPSIAFESDPNTGIYRPGENTLAFVEGGVEAMRIDSSGRLLVGTSSTSAAARMLLEGHSGNAADGGLLLIQRGEAAASIASGANLGYLRFADNAGNLYAEIRAQTDGAGGSNDYPGRLTFSTTADGAATPTERLRITSAGNVGIGTSSPTTLLDVNADTARVRTARTPASATATGATGEICWDANYIYVAVGTNTWKRAALSTW